jgi:DNA polymerase-3 subunit chi
MRVDFYLLTNEEPDAIWLLACRLVEKAYQRGHRVFVQCKDQHDAEHLDELLWTYKDDSFIPHNLQGEGPEPPPPVQIGFDKEPRGFNDILINMSNPIPTYASRFKRVIELVATSEEAKAISRDHYREYRSKGCQLHLHTIPG